MGNWFASSWKGQLQRGEPLPLDLKLTEEVLRKLGVGKRKARIVFQRLYGHKWTTWGTLLVLLEEGEERVKMEVGDDLSARMILKFFREYCAKSGVTLGSRTQDVTTSVLNSLLPKLDELPPLENLDSMFLQPMPAFVPVPAWLAEAIFAKTTNQTSSTFKGTVGCLRASDTERTALEGVFHSLLHLDVGKKVIDRTEDQFHQIYDLFFQQLLEKLLDSQLVDFEFHRNASEGPDKIANVRSGTKRPSGSRSGHSSSGKRSKTNSFKGIPTSALRPDLLVYIQKLLFLRGEEKRHGVSLEEAESDLIKKTFWCPAVMGRLPYTLAYGACGEKFQLYAIHPLPTTNDIKLMKIGRELNLTRTYDALELVGWVVHIARLMCRANAQIESKDVPPIGKVWERVSGQYSKITIHETYLEKCLLENDGNRVRWEGEGGLKQLYALVSAGKITGTIKLKESMKTIKDTDNQEVALTLLLRPLGYRVVPLLGELQDFLMDVLAALHSMHVNGWVHRDVKLKNIVKRTDGQWMLIDLEYAAKLDRKGTADWPWFDHPGYPMPVRKEHERWAPEHDVKQVAIMLGQLDYFQQHPHRKDILGILMETQSAEVMDRLRPLLS